jgi:hypothetical protein
MDILFLIIYLVVAIISGCLLGVPIKDFIGEINWINEWLEISSSHMSNGTCRFISVVIAVIIALVLYFIICESLDNGVGVAIFCAFLIPLLTFIVSFILSLIALAIFWIFTGAFFVIIIIIVALVFLFE